MKRIRLALILTAVLCALVALGARAEVTLKEYHARHLINGNTSLEYTSRVYDFAFRQYSQPINSNGLINLYNFTRDDFSGVPKTGDVLLVFSNNPVYLKRGETDEVGFYYAYSQTGRDYLPLTTLKAKLSAFPGKVAFIVCSDASPNDGAAFNQVFSEVFSESKYTLLSFMVGKKTGGTNIANVCRALGYKPNGDYIKALDKIYADANKDRIVTSGELYNYLLRLYSTNALGLFKGEDLPIYFATKRIRLELPEKSHVLNGRESFTIVPIIEPAGAVDSFIWSSSNKKVATVKDGVITGVAPGKTNIFLKADGKTLKTTVTVNKISASTARIIPPDSDVYVRDVLYMKVKLEPANTTDSIASWTSTNTKVAKVNKHGRVEMLKHGKTTIIVTTKQGLRLQCPITVNKIDVTDVVINRDVSPSAPDYGTAGFTISYSSHVLPENASYPGLRWTSSKSSVASVSSSGRISCKKPGTVTIRARSVDNPALYEEFQLIVRPNQHVWPAPTPADFSGTAAGLYALPKRLYYSGSTLMAEVYVYNHTGSKIKSIDPFYACLINVYNDPDFDLLYYKKVGRHTFSKPIFPEKAGVYRFSIWRKKINLNYYSDYTPMIFPR